jgi:Zn-dependent peptidase ImmA (M78 family)
LSPTTSAHRRRRATLNIAHEFGHLIRGHRPLAVEVFNAALVVPYYSQRQEDEAYGYALALLLPYAPLRQYLAAGASYQAIADHHGVSLQAVQMRLQLVGLWSSSTKGSEH